VGAQRLGGRHTRPRHPGPHRDTGSHFAQIGARSRHHKPRRSQLIDQRRGKYHHIRSITGHDLVAHRAHRAEFPADFVPGLALKFLRDFFHHRLGGAAAQYA
jgi:hypothetical protein